MQFIIKTLVTTMVFSFCVIVTTGFAQPHSLSKKKPGHSTKETIASKLNELQPLSAIATNEINFYPDEVFFGDTVYITHFLESKTDLELRWNRRTFADRIRQAERSEITLKYKDLVYNYTQDYYYSNWNGSGSISGQMIDFLLPTHGRLFIGSLTAEIPPLEDLDTPFWIRIRNDLDRDERVNLTIEVKNNTFTSYLPLDRRLVGQELLESSHMITIIKRERDEMESLDRWRQFRTAFPLPGLNWNDPSYVKDTFLENLWNEFAIYGSMPFRKNGNYVDDDNGQDVLNIALYNEEVVIPYYNVMRVDHRKPPAGAAPTTVEGWRELETEFDPSVLRDEIQFANLMIKYSLVRKSNDRDVSEVKREIVEWLKSKPETQRFALIDYFYNNPLPSWQLFSELEEELDFPYKRNDRIAPSTNEQSAP